uniref:Uncharacterized protein n=1 Tax=Rhizophora mucronata TaxID=61149 RepID=A0A2P2PS37_RHIMU
MVSNAQAYTSVLCVSVNQQHISQRHIIVSHYTSPC